MAWAVKMLSKDAKRKKSQVDGLQVESLHSSPKAIVVRARSTCNCCGIQAERKGNRVGKKLPR
jgi:hypothetical protein